MKYTRTEVKKKSNKGLKAVIIILVLLFVLVCGLFTFFMVNRNSNVITNYQKVDVEQNIDGQQTKPVIKREDEHFDVQVLDDMTVKKGESIVLKNYDTNDVYIKYTFTDFKTGKVLYESKMVFPGTKFNVVLSDYFNYGTTKVTVCTAGYDMETLQVLNTTSVDIDVTVK